MSAKQNIFLDGIVLVIATLVFFPYLSGEYAPPWDFWGGYLTNSHSWWDLGGLVNPPPFLPYLGGSSPSHLLPQAGQWYLPIGLTFLLFGGYTPLAAAALQAGTAVFGAIGARRVINHFGFHPLLSVLGGVGYLFSAGFFGNAQHNDIVRGWAFVPWALLFLITFRKNGPIKTLIWSFFWFQFFVGVYPGMIVASAYSLAALFLVQAYFLHYQASKKSSMSRDLIAQTPILLGFIMSLVKWIPFLLSTGYSGSDLNQLVFDFSTITTLSAPFVEGNFSNDVTMRTIFLIPIILLAAPFAMTKKNRALAFGSTLVVTALLLGLLPELPVLEISRFRFSDFKPFLHLGLILLGLSGLNQILTTPIKNTKLILLSLLSSIIATVVIWGASEFSNPSGFATTIIWVGSSSIIIGALFLSRKKFHEAMFRNVTLILLITTALALGSSWAQSSSLVWMTQREATERHLFNGQTAEELIANRSELGEFRPNRLKPNSSEEILSQFLNGGEYSRTYNSGGYINMKGVEIYERYFQSAQNLGWVYEFISKSPRSYGVADYVLATDSDPCSYQYCYLLPVEAWKPGNIEMQLDRPFQGILLVNELNYEGWTVRGCQSNSCAPLTLLSQEDSTVLAVSLNESNEFDSVQFKYETPGGVVSQILFLSGALLAILPLILQLFKKGSIALRRHSPPKYRASSKAMKTNSF